jgi:ABC-type nickel/cobalt efflux system permease component RcnA
MLLGLGATVRPVLAAFTPETGAYDSSGGAAAQRERATDHAHEDQVAHQHAHAATQPGQAHDD